jgi:upstream activation factor subunit UAF30
MGALFASRTEVVKKVWAYIRENGCQNPNDKREIICDERLESLFGLKSFTMFKMNTFLAPVR